MYVHIIMQFYVIYPISCCVWEYVRMTNKLIFFLYSKSLKLTTKNACHSFFCFLPFFCHPAVWYRIAIISKSVIAVI